MTKQVNITKEPPPFRSMDYDALYREGIEWIQRYAGAIWTDYNLHDPGVTLLEYLCFGITDVGYRCNFPVEDLLYSRENKKLEIEDNAFFFPDKILPCAPLTQNDYRRIFLDQMLEEVDNVWVNPVNHAEGGFSGLYDIQIQLNEAMENDDDREKKMAEVEAKARRLFAKQRNLCEDIHSVYILKREILDLEASIVLEMDAPAEQVLADLIHKVENFLALRPTLYSFDALEASGMDINDILEGPAPEYGFIKTDALRLLPPVLSMADLKDVIDNVEGVRSVEWLRPQQTEKLSMEGNTYFALGNLLDNDKHPIRLSRNGRQLHPNYVVVQQILNAHHARDYKQLTHPLDLRKPTPLSDKDLADIGAYYSIQRFFPAVYGIGAYGLPRDADFQRQAQARQLKGYLAIFEIMLASYLKQLTQLRHLFSTDKKAAVIREDQILKTRSLGAPIKKDIHSTYFAQFPFDIPDIKALLYTEQAEQGDMEVPINEEMKEAINEGLSAFTALSDHSLERRNEFLDHLLARFGETFNSDLLGRLSEHAADPEYLQKELIEAKCRVLRKYDTLSRDRGLGFNYLNPMQPGNWPQDNVSGLKKRLYFWLNWIEKEDPNERYEPAAEDLKKKKKLIFESHGTTDFFPFEDFEMKTGNPSDNAGLPLNDLLQNGENPDCYQIKPADNEADFEVWFKETLVLFAFNEENAVFQRDKFIKNIREFNKKSRGFFIVEHLLLRPQANPSEADQALPEFCNHRLSIVSPAWNKLFVEKDNRMFFENLVAQELPAHLRADFYWLGWDQMKNFESVYKDWLYEKSRGVETDVPKLDDLSRQLREML